MPLLAHDVEYCFTSAVELGHMTADVAAFFSYFHPSPNKWFDEHETTDTEFRGWEGRFPARAAEEYIRHRGTLTPRQRAVCSYEGLLALGVQTQETAREVVGGMLGQVPDGALTKRVVRRLLSPDAIRRFAKKDPWAECRRTAAKALMARATEDTQAFVAQTDVRALRSVTDWINAERETQRQEYARVLEQVRLTIEKPLCSSPEWKAAYDEALRTKKKLEPMRRRHERRNRKALAKGFQLVSSLMGYEKARMFISGEHISVAGQRFTFVMRKQGSSTTVGHAGLEIQITTPSGEPLSHLCLYFEDTPAIDQIAAVALHVASGEEDDLIRTGNLYKEQVAAATYAPLVALKPPKPRLTMSEDGKIVLPPFIARMHDEDARHEIRMRAVPIAERIVRDLIDPRLLRLEDWTAVAA